MVVVVVVVVVVVRMVYCIWTNVNVCTIGCMNSCSICTLVYSGFNIYVHMYVCVYVVCIYVRTVYVYECMQCILKYV